MRHWWAHAERRAAGERGLTLVELMVTVMILGVVIAIAVPSFVSARRRGYNRAAQVDLRSALVASKVVITDTQDYGAVAATIVAELNSSEPSMDFVEGDEASGPANGDAVSVSVFEYDPMLDPTYSELNLARRSATGECFYLRDIPKGSSLGDIPGEYRGFRSFADMPTCSGDEVAQLLTSPVNFQGW